MGYLQLWVCVCVFDQETAMDTHIEVRKKGSMDESLFIETVLFKKSLPKFGTKVQMGYKQEANLGAYLHQN